MTIAAAAIALALAGAAWATGVWSTPAQLDQHAEGAFNSYAAACPTAALCFGLAGSANSLEGGSSDITVYDRGAHGTPGAYDFTLDPQWATQEELTLTALQCPSAGLCAGIAHYQYEDNDTDIDEYDIVVASHPTAGGGSWHLTMGKGPHPTVISCPTAGFCAVAGPGGLSVSTDPAADQWTTVTTATSYVALSCPTTTFCAAVDAAGNAWTTSDPTGGSGAWVKSTAPTQLAYLARLANTDMQAIPFGCSGPALCVADPGSTVGAGTAMVSTNPAGTTAWTLQSVSSTHIKAIGCVPGGTCVIGDQTGHLFTSADPGAGAAWTSVATADTRGINSVSCTAMGCVAAAYTGASPLVARVPRNGPWQWTPLTVSGYGALSSVACPTSRQCVGADSANVYRTLRPGAGIAAWQHTRHNLDGPIFDTACWSASVCLATVSFGAGGGNGAFGELDRFDPASRSQAFKGDLADPDENDAMNYVTCAQRTCVAGSPGYWYQSNNPANTRSWHRVDHPRFDVTCLQGNRRCVSLPAVPSSDLAGPDLAVAAKRNGPWHPVDIDPGQEITGLACASAHACAVVDDSGHMLVSAKPTGPASSWKLSASDPDGFNGVACPSPQRCLAVDDNGGVVDGRP